MILTTTPVIEGHPILEYKQVVTAEAIIGANVFKDFFANLRDTFGARGSMLMVVVSGTAVVI